MSSQTFVQWDFESVASVFYLQPCLSSLFEALSPFRADNVEQQWDAHKDVCKLYIYYFVLLWLV